MSNKKKQYSYAFKNIPDDVMEIVFDEQNRMSKKRLRSVSIKEAMISIIRKNKKAS